MTRRCTARDAHTLDTFLARYTDIAEIVFKHLLYTDIGALALTNQCLRPVARRLRPRDGRVLRMGTLSLNVDDLRWDGPVFGAMGTRNVHNTACRGVRQLHRGDRKYVAVGERLDGFQFLTYDFFTHTPLASIPWRNTLLFLPNRRGWADMTDQPCVQYVPDAVNVTQDTMTFAGNNTVVNTIWPLDLLPPIPFDNDRCELSYFTRRGGVGYLDHNFPPSEFIYTNHAWIDELNTLLLGRDNKWWFIELDAKRHRVLAKEYLPSIKQHFMVDSNVHFHRNGMGTSCKCPQTPSTHSTLCGVAKCVLSPDTPSTDCGITYNSTDGYVYMVGGKRIRCCKSRQGEKLQTIWRFPIRRHLEKINDARISGKRNHTYAYLKSISNPTTIQFEPPERRLDVCTTWDSLPCLHSGCMFEQLKVSLTYPRLLPSLHWCDSGRILMVVGGLTTNNARVSQIELIDMLDFLPINIRLMLPENATPRADFSNK
jgi:hypothetical protein